MNDNSLPKFLGDQCRKYRKMKGLTQAELGEMIGTTDQTISNYETSGISRVETEAEISKALGVNLRDDVADKEGNVGEVGKEILFVLIEKGGSCEVKYLEENELYGMSKERVDHEIRKIAELDMCSRDKYVDLYGEERDDLFITAKGIITYKNLVSDDYHAKQLREYLPNVRSYEMMLVPNGKSEMSLPVARDMEEYVELRKWKPLIYKIPIFCNYKADYIAHLYHKWANSAARVTGGLLMADDVIKNFFPGVSAYHDIIFRMAYGYTNAWRNESFFETHFNISNEVPEEFYNEYDWEDGIDEVRDEALMEFINEF
ncbi:MAG: helix-turn-helix domain-containing protein, partial [Lachnospiraceae bacterium]|nr:helix-turn-helix domain-containing protein [Lachnospiraceae bacterium]